MKIHDPAMTFADEAAANKWQDGLTKNKDPYGHACYRFASEWATRMELALAADGVELSSDIAVDKWLKANAQRIGGEADSEGITGFMYGCAVNILAHCWRFGDRLRRWHNIDCQIGTEGEKANESGAVLNPAVINLT